MSSSPQANAPAAPATASFGESERWFALVTVLIGTFMILLDSTIVNVAIPSIQTSLKASFEDIEWVVSGYALSYGLLLIPAGRLGDRFGHKTLFMIGLIGFTLFSTLCGVATSSEMLVLWRVLQGAMAGVMNPQITAVIQIAFPPKERGKAFGIYGSVIGIATAAGPLVGGLLIAAKLTSMDWKPIFLINIPIGIVALIMAIRVMKQTYGRSGDLDYVGTVLVSVAVLLLSVPLVEGRDVGWPAWTYLSMAGSIVVFALFGYWEHRRIVANQPPLVDIRLFRNRAFTAGMGIALAYFGGFVGIFFVASLLLQSGFQHSALYAGLTMMPFSFGSLASASQSDRIAQRLGRNCLTLGSILVMLGLAGMIVTMHQAGTSLSGWKLAPWFLIAGLGSGMIIAPNVTLVLAGVPRQDAGSASGVLSATQRIGQAIGVCLVGIVLFGVLQSNAGSSAGSVTPALRNDLAAAQIPAAGIDQAVDTFQQCFEKRASSSDPSAVPEGCSATDTTATDPASVAFTKAGKAALADNFNTASEDALVVSLVLVAVTFLLIFLLPRRSDDARAHAAPPSE